MAKVYHMRDLFGPEGNFPDEYMLVAETDSDVLGEVFQLTNHIHDHWWNNAGVKLIGEPTHRSTSVGDIVENSEGRWLCEPIGWTQLA